VIARIAAKFLDKHFARARAHQIDENGDHQPILKKPKRTSDCFADL
jgi:hypothetical protein